MKGMKEGKKEKREKVGERQATVVKSSVACREVDEMM